MKKTGQENRDRSFSCTRPRRLKWTASRLRHAVLSLLVSLMFSSCFTGSPLEKFVYFLAVSSHSEIPPDVGKFLLAVSALDAADARIGMPRGPAPLGGEGPVPLVDFLGFQQNSGTLSIHFNFMGEPDFVFPITGQGNDGCIDFGFNGCDGNDVGLTYVPAEHAIDITSPFPQEDGLFQGLYRINFDSPVLAFAPGPGELADITIQARRESEAVQLTMPYAPGLVGFMTTLPVGQAGTLRVVPTVVLNNPNPTTVHLQMRFFNSDGGEDQPLQVDGQEASATWDLELEGHSGSQLTLSTDQADLVRAWGVMTSDTAGVAASVVYSTFSESAPAGSGSATLEGEAGVSTVAAFFHHVFQVEALASGFDTAFAVVNATGSQARLQLKLAPEATDALPAGAAPDLTTELVIAPGSQEAVFFLEPFQGPGPDFAGTLIIDSDTAVAINTIRTLVGVQASSLESSAL